MFLSEPIRKGHRRKFRRGFNTTAKHKIDACTKFKELVESGKMKINFFSKKKTYLFSKVVSKNDIVILLSEGHGFKMLKNCKFIEVKQGPFFPKKDKNKF